jgi:hypothetical protein
MTRTLRALALVTISFSLALAIYSSAQFPSGQFVALYVAQLLRTTGTALGLTLAIVALVANAQARRWRWFGVYLVLAIVTIYGPEFLIWFPIVNVSGWFPAFYPPPLALPYPSWVVLGFCVPPMVTALLVLAQEFVPRIWEMSPGPAADEDNDLELTPLQD